MPISSFALGVEDAGRRLRSAHDASDGDNQSHDTIDLLAAFTLIRFHIPGRICLNDDVRGHPAENWIPIVSQLAGDRQLLEPLSRRKHAGKALANLNHFKAV